MSDQLLEDSWRMLSRARGVGLAMRLCILGAPLIAVGATNAAGDTVWAVNVAVVAAAVVCALAPDSHAGLLVVGLIAVQWTAAVHDTTTPWVLAVAVSISVFHSALAAAIAVPPAARWTRAMVVRWSRRLVVLVLASGCTWVVVLLVGTVEVAGSALLVTASLVVLAVAGLWAREGRLGSRRT